MKTIITAIAALFVVSCTQTQSQDGVITCTESSKGAVTSSLVCKLGENIDFISDVYQFDVIDDEHFVAITRDAMYLYNMDGEQIRIIGSQGRARGEYIMLMAISSFDGDIFVGCLSTRKIIQYNQQGEFVQEYSMQGDYKDFVVSDKYISLYAPVAPVGSPKEGKIPYTVSVYDRASGEIIAQANEYDEVDKIFAITMVCNGLVGGDDDEVTILKAKDLSLNRFNFVTGEQERLLSVQSPTYQLDTSVEYAEISQSSNVMKMIDFLENSSCPMSAGIIGDKLYIVTHEHMSGDSPQGIVYERHLLTIDMKRGRGEWQPIEYSSSNIDRCYQMYNGAIYTLSLSDGEYCVRKMDI